MNYLSLFSGAGGGDLACQHLLGWRCLGYVEWEDYCQRVLRQRQEDGFLDVAPIFGDIRAFISEGYAREYRGMVDVVTGGFPCQPYSTAARGRNRKDDCWASCLDAILAADSGIAFLENVSPAAIEMAAQDLRSANYDCSALSLSAKDLGADHIRTRHWLLAHADGNGELLLPINAEMAELPRIRQGLWADVPVRPRVSHGVSNRVDRLRALGNGQVPAVAATAWHLLTGGIVS